MQKMYSLCVYQIVDVGPFKNLFFWRVERSTLSPPRCIRVSCVYVGTRHVNIKVYDIVLLLIM